MRKASIFVSIIFIFSWILVLTMVSEGTAVGQTLVSYTVKINIDVTSTVDGVIDTASLYLGVHGDGPNPPGTVEDNNYGQDVDPIYGSDGEWVELPTPPDPPNFKILGKFVQIPGRTASGSDGGIAGLSPYDFRGFREAAQVDTFCLNVYGDNDSTKVALGTVTLSWPSTISLIATNWELKRKRNIGTIYDQVVANMVGSTSYTDLNAGQSNNIKYLVIVSGLILTGVEETKVEAPTFFELRQNYPNPFNPKAVIPFSVAKKEMTTLKLYNTLGQEVMTLFDGIASPGTIYKATVNGSQLASGVYFYRLISGTQSEIKKMVLLK